MRWPLSPAVRPGHGQLVHVDVSGGYQLFGCAVGRQPLGSHEIGRSRAAAGHLDRCAPPTLRIGLGPWAGRTDGSSSSSAGCRPTGRPEQGRSPRHPASPRCLDEGARVARSPYAPQVADEERQALALEWAVDVDRAETGSELLLRVSLRNHTTRDLAVRFSSPCARVVDADGQQVDIPGWTTAAGHRVTLRPAEEHSMSCVVELRGPRAGARRAPLPTGEYFLECSVRVFLDGAASGPEMLLTTPRQPVTLDARQPPPSQGELTEDGLQ